jgi:iron complex outermembrane recepter protein
VLQIYGQDLGKIPSNHLLNANLNWEEVAGLPVDVSLFATNLTDEENYAYVAGLAPAGLETGVLGQPRMYGLRVRYRFGAE